MYRTLNGLFLGFGLSGNFYLTVGTLKRARVLIGFADMFTPQIPTTAHVKNIFYLAFETYKTLFIFH